MRKVVHIFFLALRWMEYYFDENTKQERSQTLTLPENQCPSVEFNQQKQTKKHARKCVRHMNKHRLCRTDQRIEWLVFDSAFVYLIDWFDTFPTKNLPLSAWIIIKLLSIYYDYRAWKKNTTFHHQNMPRHTNLILFSRSIGIYVELDASARQNERI